MYNQTELETAPAASCHTIPYHTIHYHIFHFCCSKLISFHFISYHFPTPHAYTRTHTHTHTYTSTDSLTQWEMIDVIFTTISGFTPHSRICICICICIIVMTINNTAYASAVDLRLMNKYSSQECTVRYRRHVDNRCLRDCDGTSKSTGKAHWHWPWHWNSSTSYHIISYHTALYTN
jgi:hypothetical protein